MRTLVVLVLTASWLAACASTGAAEVLHDDFNDDTISAAWGTFSAGTGVTIAQTSQRVEVTLAADSTPPGTGPFPNTFQTGYSLRCSLRGDFDVQVDYSLLIWPSGSGAVAGLSAFPNPLSTERGVAVFRSQCATSCPAPISGGAGGYFCNVGVNGQPLGVSTTSSDLSGTLRITRSGNVGTGYYASSTEWVPLNWGQVATDDTQVFFNGVGVSMGWGHELVKVAFDNFIVNQGLLVGCNVCSDASAAVDVVQPKLTIGKLNTPPGDDTLRLQGTLTLPSPFSPPLDPLGNGVRLLIDGGGRQVSDNNVGNVLDLTIPGGTGWTANRSGTKWTYRDTSATPPGGIYKVVIRDKSKTTPGLLKFTVNGKTGSYAVTPADLPVTARIILGPSGGQCADTSFSSCAFNASGSTLKCK